MNPHWSEWIELTGEVWRHNSEQGRKDWLETNYLPPALYSYEWPELPKSVQEVLTQEYHDEQYAKHAEPIASGEVSYE